MNNLEAARGLLEEKKFGEAREQVAETKEDSFYYLGTQELLANIDNAEGAQVAYREAKALYQSGDNHGARIRIDEALAKFPGNKILLAVRDDIALISPLADELEKGGDLLASQDVAGIKKMIVSCNKLLNVNASSDVADTFRAECRESSEAIARQAGHHFVGSDSVWKTS